MKTIINIVQVTCVCGHRATIYSQGQGVQAGKQCWRCSRFVYYILSGNKAVGKVLDTDNTVTDTRAKFIGTEEK